MPIFILLGIISVTIPAFGVFNFDASILIPFVCIWSLHLYAYELVAECLGVWIKDPIIGMLSFLAYWLLSFLCCGLYLPSKDMYWPVKIFYYVSTFRYYGSSVINLLLESETFDSCDITTNTVSAICTSSTTGSDIITELGKIISLVDNVNYLHDTLIVIAIVAFYQIIAIIGLVMKRQNQHLTFLWIKERSHRCRKQRF